MAKQVNNGKAFEYAIAKSYADFLIENGLKVRLINDSAFNVAKINFDNSPAPEQRRFFAAANATLETMVKIEPGLTTQQGERDELLIRIANDAEGIGGDVRDIIFCRKYTSWEIGISAKNNHEAVKHSRLSKDLDFGKSWVGVNCSSSYWDDVLPIFNYLSKLKDENPGMNWAQIDKKEENVYLPLLDAFKKEVLFIYNNNLDIAGKLVSYLIGRHPFYKIIKNDTNNLVIVKAFNLDGYLNKTIAGIKPHAKTETIKLPKRIIEFDLMEDSLTTLNMVLDGGWSISFRIHNAEKKVVPSLKFDINLTGNPPVLFTQHLFQ